MFIFIMYFLLIFIVTIFIGTLLFQLAEFIIGFGLGLCNPKPIQKKPHYRWNIETQQWDIL
jgi:hypothetical protein